MGAAALPRYHQIAQIDRRRLSCTAGDEEQMDGLLDHRRRGEPDIGAVGHKGGIELDESARLLQRLDREQRFQSAAVLIQYLTEAAHFDALRQTAQIGERGVEAAIDEDRHRRGGVEQPIGKIGTHHRMP